MVAVDVDRETAHAEAARELARQIYPKPALGERFSAWLEELLRRLVESGSALPGGWLAIVLLGLLVTAAVIVAARIAARTMGDRGGARRYGGPVIAAAEHRTRAERSAAQGDWASAIRQRVLAIGRQLEEDGVLTPVAGRTAVELATEAGESLPEFAGELSSAATVFNDVTYGGQPGAQTDYRLVSDLDDRLRILTRQPAGSGQALR